MFKAFTYGVRFRIGENEYEILRQRDQDFEVLNLKYDEKELISLSELLNAYNETDHNKKLFYEQDIETKDSIEFDFTEYTSAEIDIEQTFSSY